MARHRRRPDGRRRDPPRCPHRRLLGRAARRSDRGGAERGHPAAARRAAAAAHAGSRLPARTDRGRRDPPRRRCGDRGGDQGRQLRLGAPRFACRRRRQRRARRVPRLGRHVLDPHCATDRASSGDHREHRGPRDRVSRDRRARIACAQPGDARRQRTEHGPLDGRRHAPTGGVGDRSLVADGRQPGGDPARIERGHLGVPLGGEGDRDADDLLGTPGLRRDRAPACDGHRLARGGRRQPWKPALGRGRGRDPHRQPDGGGEEVQSRLSGVSRERRQRDAHTRPLHLGSHPRVDVVPACDPPGRASARSPRRHLPVDEGSAVRLRARPDRLGRPHRHDARAARRLRDVLELRRGGTSLGARARRHPRSTAQARRPLRAGRARSSLRAQAVRDRRPFRPRANAGCDLQATQRVRPRRACRSLARARRGGRDCRRRRAELHGRPRLHRGDRHEEEAAEERRLRSGRRSCSARATSASST